MIDPNTSVVFERLPEIVPIREFADYSGVQPTKGVNVTKFEHASISSAGLRLEQCVASPRCRLVAVNILWNNVEVSAYDCRYVTLEPQFHLHKKTVHPGQLVLKLRRSCRIAVGQVYIHHT